VNDIAPGWYRDPVDPTQQRYWDGEGYLGDPLPADAIPPPGPPAGTPPSATTALSTAAQPSAPADPLAPPAPSPPAADALAPTPSSPAGVPAPPTGVANSAPTRVAPGGGPLTPPHGTPPAGPGQLTTAPNGMPGWPAYPRLVLPEPRPHGYRLAGLGARLIARLVDMLAVLGLNILVNGYFVYQYYKVNLPFWQEVSRRFYAGESTAGVEPPERASTLLIIILVLATALWFAYEVPAHANTGQTLGKRLMGIKVMRLESDEQLGFRRSIRRWNTIGLPTLLWTCFGLGFVLQFVDGLWVLFDRPMHQALHDKSAVTVVVEAEPKPGAAQPTHDPSADQPENNDQQERPA
jgi:uncharacterized RDD family membrane protein YckC